MRLGLTVGYSGRGMGLPLDTILEAEKLGFDSVWTAEAYGSDAITPLAWIGALTTRIRLGTAIMQIPARTPAMCAMTAMTLDALSGGPQVVEGWHGVRYGKPLSRTREYIGIIRQILRREQPAEFHGEEYDLPYTGAGATGLGKPLKSILHGRADLPIYTAAISPAGVKTAAEVADGFFPIWMSPEKWSVFAPHVEAGFKKAGGGKSLANFDVAPFVTCIVGDDLAKCRNAVKPMLALYIGGMGARDKNFYNDYARRLGYEEAAVKIQNAFLAGDRGAAMAAVPDALVDEVSLIGPKERIRDRLAAWKASPVGTLCLGTGQIEAVRTVAELVL